MTNKEKKKLKEIKLTTKEQYIEILANALAILMLFAFFLKVLFF